MKITDHIKNAKGKTLFSFELLPPLKGQSIQGIYDAIDPLMEFKPPFIDVTYHREEYIYKKRVGGYLEKIAIRKRPGTVGICSAIINRYKTDAVPHIICGGFTREETENALAGYRAANESAAALEYAVSESRRAAELARLRYDNGASDYLTVLDAERTALDTEDQYADASTRRATTLAALYKALAGDFAR